VCFYVGLAAGYCARGASQVQRLQGVFIGEKPTEPGAYTGQPVAQVLEHGEQVDGLDCRGAGSVADAHPLVAPEGPGVLRYGALGRRRVGSCEIRFALIPSAGTAFETVVSVALALM
jgi:hypothetical protein